MATSDQFDFLREEQGVIEDGDASNIGAGPILPFELQAFPSEIEQRGDARSDRATPDHGGDWDKKLQECLRRTSDVESVVQRRGSELDVVSTDHARSEQSATPSPYGAAYRLAHRLEGRSKSIWGTLRKISYDATHAAAWRTLLTWRALSRMTVAFMQPSGAAWRIGGWSFVNACREGGTRLVVATRLLWREMRVAGRAFPMSGLHVKARTAVGHARIPTLRIRLKIGPDIRRALGLFVCGVAVGVVGVVLLTPWVPSVTFAMRIGEAMPVDGLEEMPSSAAKVPEAPIRFAGSLPAQAVASSSDREAGTVRSGSGESNQADGIGPFRRSSAAPRPAPVLAYRGSLAVRSSPQGAQVFVNSVSVGTTPLVLRNMPVGSRAVRIELDGHGRWSSVVRIVASERTQVAAKLLPSPPQ